MTTPILTAAVLTDAGFAHGFTTRLGGVSEGSFASLDLATARDPAALRENQRRVAEAVGFAPDRLRQVTQVHGARAVAAGEGTGLGDEADALVAGGGSGFAVAVRVADCVPVLVGDRRTGGVAAIHAGWRGVEAGIVGAALARLGGDASALVAAIGPSIGPCCFEVGGDVAARIASAAGADVTARREGDKAFVDLRLAVRRQLRARGLDEAAIEDVAGCTRCDAVRFHSYRRDGDGSGRLMGVVVARAVSPAPR